MKPVSLARALVCATATIVTAPADARFLQVDPVGYNDQINLYAYVMNDPLNRIDFTGREAILVNELNGSKTLLVPYRLQSSSVTAGDISRVVSGYKIEGNLRIEVVNTDTPIMGMLNEVTVGSGPNSAMCGGVGECTSRQGGQDSVYINGDNQMAAEATGHDLVGHAAGSLEDGYREGPPGPSGRGESVLKDGYTKDNFMADRSGNAVNASQVQKMQQNANVTGCRQPDNSVKGC